MIVVVGCGWKERRKGEGRSRMCGWRRGEEGGRKVRGMEEERATDSMEPQNSHKQSLFSGLVRHFRRIGKSFEFCLSCRHRNNFEVCDSPSERRVPLWNLSWGMPGLSSLIAGAPVLGVGPMQEGRHGFGGLENTPLGQRGTDPKR